MQGWIKLHRKVKCHWLFTENRTFTKFEAWIDLLLEVNHKGNKFMLGHELVEVQKGQTITSVRKLCERWGWSNSKVTQFLKLLQSDNMIHVESDTKKTVITIVNYGVYQVEGDAKNDSEATLNRQENDTEQTPKHTNKNDKKEKNEKNDKEDKYISTFDSFWNLYPRKEDKKKAFEKFKTAIKKHDVQIIIDGTRDYAKQCEIKKTEKRYIKLPSSFLNAESFLNNFDLGANNKRSIFDQGEESKKRQEEIKPLTAEEQERLSLWEEELPF
jgi:hypothetical protein